MRKGYLLVEIVVVLFVTAMVIVTLERFFRTFTYDLPAESRLIQENVTLINAVNHLRADVVSAKNLSESVNGPDEPNMLVIRMPDGVISYKFSNGRITRSFVGGAADEANGDMVWSVPHGSIEWRVCNKDKAGYAVEVSACIEDKRFGHTRKKMANSGLFFAGLLLEAAK